MVGNAQSLTGTAALPPSQGSEAARQADRLIMRAAAAMQCGCAGACGRRQALDCLYRTVIDTLSRNIGRYCDPAPLLGPLAMVVGHQKTRHGQQACADFAEAMMREDGDGMLDACRALLHLEAQRAGAGNA